MYAINTMRKNMSLCFTFVVSLVLVISLDDSELIIKNIMVPFINHHDVVTKLEGGGPQHPVHVAHQLDGDA